MAAHGPKIYKFTVTVTEDGNPSLFTSEEIKITVNDPEAIILELVKGWNLISLPQQHQDKGVGDLFGNKISETVWAWNGVSQRFEIASSLSPTQGFWVYANDDFLDDNAFIISSQ